MQQPNDLKYIEKSFLLLVALSVLLHLVAYKVVSLIPSETAKKAPVATMVDLTDLPIPAPPAKDKRKPPTREAKRKPEPKPEPPKPKPEPAKPKPPPPPVKPLTLPPAAGPKPVPTPPKPMARPIVKPFPPTPTAPRREAATPQPPRAASPTEATKPESVARKAETGGLPLEKGGTARVARGQGLFKPRPQQGAKEGSKEGTRQANLFPSARNMQDMEENYRKKYRDLEQGDTRMIDTEDPLIGVYAHRLLVKAQDSVELEGHRAPPHHNGVGVLQVTILRDGSLEEVRIMEPSGNKDVDDFFIRSVYKTGYVGPLPKKWPHEKLNLVWVYTSRIMQGPQ